MDDGCLGMEREEFEKMVIKPRISLPVCCGQKQATKLRPVSKDFLFLIFCRACNKSQSSSPCFVQKNETFYYFFVRIIRRTHFSWLEQLGVCIA